MKIFIIGLLLSLDVFAKASSSASFTVRGVIPPIVKVLYVGNKTYQVLHNVPVIIEDSVCTVISTTEQRCVGEKLSIGTVE